MNKYILLLLVISLFSCEKKKPSATSQAQTNVVEVKTVEEVNDTVVENVEKVEEVIANTKELKESVEALILPKTVFFGDVKVEISETDGVIDVTSNNEFAGAYNLNLKGKTDAFIETDVDGNGFNEFYIVTNTGDLAAFSSYNNKSFGQVYVPKKPYSFYADCTKVKFWEAKNKKLAISFEDNDGKLNTVRYKLVKGETSFQLVAE